MNLLQTLQNGINPASLLTRFANSRTDHGFLIPGSKCFQELRFGLRIAQPKGDIAAKRHRHDVEIHIALYRF